MHSFIFTYDTEFSRGGAHWARVKAGSREDAEREFMRLFPAAVIVHKIQQEY